MNACRHDGDRVSLRQIGPHVAKRVVDHDDTRLGREVPHALDGVHHELVSALWTDRNHEHGVLADVPAINLRTTHAATAPTPRVVALPPLKKCLGAQSTAVARKCS